MGDSLFSEGLGLYQVAWDVSEPTVLRRECRALWEAMAETGARQSTLIVGQGAEQDIERDGMRIYCLPAWRWLLG